MTQMNKAQAFNTGREYAPEGQLIGYMVLSSDGDEFLPLYRVAFIDQTRGIRGYMSVYGCVSEGHIMREYDDGRYQAGLYDDAVITPIREAIKALTEPKIIEAEQPTEQQPAALVVVVDEFSRDVNGNRIGRYTVYGSADEDGLQARRGDSLYRTSRRQQVGYTGRSDEYAEEAIKRAGLDPVEWLRCAVEADEDQGSVTLLYLPRLVRAPGFIELIDALRRRGIESVQDMAQLTRFPTRTAGTGWEARI
jgi:hypothetical protein